MALYYPILNMCDIILINLLGLFCQYIKKLLEIQPIIMWQGTDLDI